MPSAGDGGFTTKRTVLFTRMIAATPETLLSLWLDSGVNFWSSRHCRDTQGENTGDPPCRD